MNRRLHCLKESRKSGFTVRMDRSGENNWKKIDVLTNVSQRSCGSKWLKHLALFSVLLQIPKIKIQISSSKVKHKAISIYFNLLSELPLYASHGSHRGHYSSQHRSHVSLPRTFVRLITMAWLHVLEVI